MQYFFPGRDSNGDCGSKMDDFPLFSRTRYQWRLWIQHERFPIFFPDAKSMEIVDPKWTISHFFPGRDISGDCVSKMDDFLFFSRTWYQWRLRIQNEWFPIFFPDAISVAIVDAEWTISHLYQWRLWKDSKWTISHFFPGRDIGACGSKMDDFPFFFRTRYQWRLWIQQGGFPFFFPKRHQWRFWIQKGRFDANSMAIVNPKLTISLFSGREINWMAIVDLKWTISHFFPGHDIRLWIQNGWFPIFLPDAKSMTIVDPK